jgi:hypothetical protein
MYFLTGENEEERCMLEGETVCTPQKLTGSDKKFILSSNKNPRLTSLHSFPFKHHELFDSILNFTCSFYTWRRSSALAILSHFDVSTSLLPRLK